MQITGLKLLGFKSFVEPAELIIDKGLTGVVGPNGCGKSNLLEALRWVMGETSYKTMRASAMDDVIFAGTQSRSSRNSAEVTLYLDNSKRLAPAAFNDSDILQVTRRIERENGSSYKINGSDVRARDVQLLFADASTGARSPALVQQGQIGQIVNSKPQARRRILEEAAGITGLHSRRHEAELRLKAAESNLARLQDVMGQLGSRLGALKRQARQAQRYRELSNQIQQAEAIVFHLNWIAAGAAVSKEEEALEQLLLHVGQYTQAESAALRIQTDTSDEIQPLRDEEAIKAAILQRFKLELERLDQEEQRMRERESELRQLLASLEHDQQREKDLITESAETLERLSEEEQRLSADLDHATAKEDEARRKVQHADSALAQTEHALSTLTQQTADHRARRRQLEQTLEEQTRQLQRLANEKYDIEQNFAELAEALAEQEKIHKLTDKVKQLADQVAALEEQLLEAEDAHAEARQSEKQARDTASTTKLKARQLETEVRTLEKLLISSSGSQWTPILDQLTVTPGYEIALGAALGDDLDAPADTSAPVHWSTLDGSVDTPLPEGCISLSRFVNAPAQLERRLAQVGIIDPADGKKLQSILHPGQRLVSQNGDLWRWDGYVATADAPTAAAQRLAERNRLEALQEQMQNALDEAEQHETELAKTSEQLRFAQDQETNLRASWRHAQSELDRARDSLTQAERANQENNKKIGALTEAKSRIEEASSEAEQKRQEAQSNLLSLGGLEDLEEQHHILHAEVQDDRAALSDAKAALTSLEWEGRARTDRLGTIERERHSWDKRRSAAQTQIDSLAERIQASNAELVSFDNLPEKIQERRSKLLNEISRAEQERQQAADQLAQAQSQLQSAGQSLKDIQSRLNAAREDRARTEARLESARERLAEQAKTIRDTLNCVPEDCLKIAQITDEQELPDLGEVEGRLARYKTDRERLGGVNLQAEQEANELESQFGTMEKEKQDLEQAIARLRQGISSLNREGRKRLMEAFDEVNKHFKRLFTTLFGGGEAELQLVESDDPLEAGLEILARPPGKKPQVLTLLSGGEKALTAMSLIFAVFLTNPSPICVLDEVDAPLDDANTNRFCTLLEDMVANTDTRFLVITHHPMTMARMNRLFGVTMAEKGVSQLVSVNLTMAEGLREAS